MIDPVFAQYNNNAVLIQQHKAQKSLYLAEYRDGLVQEKKDLGWLMASAKHYAFSMIDWACKTHWIDQEDQVILRHLFNSNISYLMNPQSTAKEEYTKKKWSETFSPQQMDQIRSIHNECQSLLRQKLPSYYHDTQKSLKSLGISNESIRLVETFLSNPSAHPDALPALLPTLYNFAEAAGIISAFYRESNATYSEVLKPENWHNPNLDPEQVKRKRELLLMMESIDLDQWDRIQQAAQALSAPDGFLTCLQDKHEQYVAEQNEVAVEKNRPMPSLEQLKAAFTLTLTDILPDIPPPKTEEGGAFLARVVQFVMVGKDRLKDIENPKDDLCFSFAELKDIKQVQEFSQHHHPLEWYVNTSPGFKRALAQGDSAQKANEAFLIDHISSFFKENMRHFSFQIGNRQPMQSSTPKRFDTIMKALHVDYFKYLREQPNALLQAQQFNRTFCESLSLSQDFPQDTLDNWLKIGAAIIKAPEATRRKDVISQLSQFTEKELKNLLSAYREQIQDGKSDQQIVEELNKMLRLHVLRIMIYANQSIYGQGNEDHPMVLLLKNEIANQANGEHSFTYPSERCVTIFPDRLVGIEDVTLSATSSSASDLGVTGVENPLFPILKLKRRFGVPSLTAIDPPLGYHSTLTNFEDIRIRPHSLPYMDRVVGYFTPAADQSS